MGRDGLSQNLRLQAICAEQSWGRGLRSCRYVYFIGPLPFGVACSECSGSYLAHTPRAVRKGNGRAKHLAESYGLSGVSKKRALFMMRCQRCRSASVHRSHVKWYEIILLVAFCRPFRCLHCRHRFYAFFLFHSRDKAKRFSKAKKGSKKRVTKRRRCVASRARQVS